jgi:hypothetical protein
MNIGMLWFDNDPKTDFSIKVERAADYYRSKYGQTPNLCFVHPSMVNGDPLSLREIEIRPNRSVMPNHFWIGVNVKNGQVAA